ncbi:hypothetical protein [Wenzhouxiangella limi]|uniref:Yip1 domain-containing protein n=1 Tax=Wenzhouxiangella limi TaxID=2707351 RepID=A0A845V6H0_9GAMM|nr:hypothetical protein [Wenzhouxiangella limi]NDY95565.1 hypothetical protein [Wenzhouxiangella limi]
MSILFSRLIQILLLRLGPQDLPPGPSVLLATLTLYLVTASLSISLGDGAGSPTLLLLLATGLPMLLVWIVLRLKSRVSRWEQTLSALYGTSALLSLLSLPLNLQVGAEPAPPIVLLSLVIFLWSFAVDAHIWRHALDTSFAAGLAVAMIMFLLSFGIISSVAGPL